MLDFKKIDSYRIRLKTTKHLFASLIGTNEYTYKGYLYEGKKPREQAKLSDAIIILLAQNKIYITRDDILVDSIKEYK